MLVFDMDGVLVDVGESYRETICRTVEHFTGRKISKELIQQYKNSGGWNNDWALSQKIAADLGTTVDYGTVVEVFQRLFLGDGTNGLIMRERWIPREGLLEQLGRRYQLAIFTGRLREEANLTLRRFGVEMRFDPLIGSDDVTNGKPSPDGLFAIAARNPGRAMWYVGDTVDDARCARAAGVKFIGVAGEETLRRDELIGLFRVEGAAAILKSVNELPQFLGNGAES